MIHPLPIPLKLYSSVVYVLLSSIPYILLSSVAYLPHYPLQQKPIMGIPTIGFISRFSVSVILSFDQWERLALIVQCYGKALNLAMVEQVHQLRHIGVSVPVCLPLSVVERQRYFVGAFSLGVLVFDCHGVLRLKWGYRLWDAALSVALATSSFGCHHRGYISAGGVFFQALLAA